MVMRRKKGVKNLFIHISLALVSMILAFPFLWMFTNSIKTKEEIWAVPPGYGRLWRSGIITRTLCLTAPF